MRTMLGDLRHAILANEHRDGEQQGVGADPTLQPKEGRRIHMAPTLTHAPEIDGHPQRDECDGECKVGRAAQESADALNGQLQAGNLRLFAVFEASQHLQVLLGGGG